jgi:ATP-dependent exoDNAse (exonuclease V) beta subunit
VLVPRRLHLPLDLPERGEAQVTQSGLTGEQREAVERRDGALFLSAGAGSGKTRVLVERFVRAVCEDGVAVERILAITFTEKAAAELKGRLREAFLARGAREHARAAEAAFISTIHGFCARLLRAHALAAGLDPEYEVLAETDAARLQYAAFDSALEAFMSEASAEDRVDLVASYTPDKLRNMVLTVHARLRAGGQRHPELPDPPEPPGPAGEREALEGAIGPAQAELAEASGVRVEKVRKQLSGCAEALALVPEGELGDPGEFEDSVLRIGNIKALQGPAVAAFTEAHEAWLKLCAARRAAQQYRHVRALLGLYAVRYEGLKRGESALDFEDLELLARDLLRDRPDIRALWSERFVHVMVDEYQDTNRLQDELIDLIAAGRLFAVGDDRQSIYGFRHADVEGFRARRARAEQEGRAARLRRNFRSTADALEVVNDAFARVWEDYDPLAPGLEGGSEGSVELLVVDRNVGRWEPLGDDPFGATMHGEPAWRACEARLLAKRIDELVRKNGDGALSCTWGDVAILMRAATDMPLYERALNERGIPTYAAGARGYFSQQQIGDLRAYLAALANPLDGVALYSMLASPLVGASLDALTLIRLHSRRAQRDPWWALRDAFCGTGSAGADRGDGAAGGGPGNGSDADRTGLAAALPATDREKLAAFVPRFAAERAAAPRLSLETVIDRAVTSSGYDRAVLALPSGDRRMANVRKLMRLAREFERGSGRDLRRFIDYVDEQDLIAAREGEAPLESESLDAVRLMTIHAAKGLEFPVVCVADLGREGRADDIALRVSNDGRVGLELASLAGRGSSALDLDELKQEEEARQEAEERRIFYVAMTRAERRLILSGAADVEKWHEAKPLGKPMDWIWRVLAPDLKEGGPPAGSVRATICSPDTVDDVLPVADRAPADAASAGRGAGEAGAEGGPEPPGFAPVQAPVALPLARLSYSALEHYARCGYRFYLERVARLRDGTAAPVGELVPVAGDDEVGIDPPRNVWQNGDAAAALAANGNGGGQLGLPLAAATATIAPAVGELDARLRGSIAHLLLEHLDFARPEAPDDAEIADRMRALGADPNPEDVADLRRLVEAFVGSALCDRVQAASRVGKELPFAFPLEPHGSGGESILVNGVLDVHALEDDGVLVVDYKSDRLEGADPQAFCDEHYGTQRTVYALAALKAGAERVDVVHAFLELPDDPVIATYTSADAATLEARLIELADGIIGGRFEPTDDPHRELCATCPGRPALCCWDESRTLAPKHVTFHS